LVIPSIQIMQNTSALVGDEKAKLGDIMNMQTEERLGGFDKAALVLPLKLFKTLRTYDVTNNGFKFLHESPLTNQNDKLQGEGLEDGVPVKRFQTFNFFVLLKKDLEDELRIRELDIYQRMEKMLVGKLAENGPNGLKEALLFLRISRREEREERHQYVWRASHYHEGRPAGDRSRTRGGGKLARHAGGW